MTSAKASSREHELLARARARRAGSAPSLATLFNEAGTRAPLICTHPVGGTVGCYGELARVLGADQPLLAVQALGLRGEAPPLRSIEEMAELALRELRARFPRGPHCLVAWSYGGSIAFELAKRLTREGQRPALLAMIDSWAPFGLEGKTAGYFDDARALVWLVLNVYGARLGDPLSLHRELQREGDREAMVGLIDARAAEAGLANRPSRQQLHRLVEVFLANADALLHWSPAPYDGKVWFFRPDAVSRQVDNSVLALGLDEQERSRFLSRIDRPADGWRGLVRELEVRAVSGDHYSVLAEPHVSELARHLAPLLANVNQPRD